MSRKRECDMSVDEWLDHQEEKRQRIRERAEFYQIRKDAIGDDDDEDLSDIY